METNSINFYFNYAEPIFKISFNNNLSKNFTSARTDIVVFDSTDLIKKTFFKIYFSFLDFLQQA